MKVTRIVYTRKLNRGKYQQLLDQAKLLGNVRSEVWHRFGSISGIDIKSDRIIRDQWLKENRDFGVLKTPWKETLRDSFGDIRASVEAAKKKARKLIWRNKNHDKEEKHRLYGLLKFSKWKESPYLRRIMRKCHRRGHNHTYNQIIVRSDNYNIFTLDNRVWLKIPSLVAGKRIAIPLNLKVSTIKGKTNLPTGNLRLILRNSAVEIHYAIEAPKQRPCGTKMLGLDKGYTEVFLWV